MNLSDYSCIHVNFYAGRTLAAKMLKIIEFENGLKMKLYDRSRKCLIAKCVEESFFNERLQQGSDRWPPAV